MTTASWSSRVRHDSDATFQEWRDELITKLGLLVTAGVLAADETNITPGAGARPATNTEQGYAVYHIADSLHGTAPIYFRLGVGTGTGATTPRLQATVGTSTNGSGVLGGTCLSTIATCMNSSAQTTDTARQSYLCSVAGFFGLGWKFDTTSNSAGAEGALIICRTVDSDGLPTVTGGFIHLSIGNNGQIQKRQAFRYAATAVAYAATNTIEAGALGINPQCPITTTVGSDIQVALGWTITPRASPLIGVCGGIPGELSAGGTFNATMVGTTARTYVMLYPAAGPFGPIGTGNGRMSIAMLWE